MLEEGIRMLVQDYGNAWMDRNWRPVDLFITNGELITSPSALQRSYDSISYAWPEIKYRYLMLVKRPYINFAYWMPRVQRRNEMLSGRIPITDLPTNYPVGPDLPDADTDHLFN